MMVKRKAGVRNELQRFLKEIQESKSNKLDKDFIVEKLQNVLAYKRRYNREYQKEYQKEYYQQNKERIKEKRRERYKKEVGRDD